MRGDKKDLLGRDGYAFLIGNPDAEHSMIWRLWADKKSNVFLSVRQNNANQTLAFKTTFHEPNKDHPNLNRHEGLTAEFFKKHFDLPVKQRHMREWVGDKKLKEGIYHAYRIYFPRSHLKIRQLPSKPGRRIWHFQIPWPEPQTYRQSALVDILFQDKDAELTSVQMENALSSMVDSWILPNGRRVNFVLHVTDCPPFEELQQHEESLLKNVEHLISDNNLDEQSLEGLRIILGHQQDNSPPGCVELSLIELFRFFISKRISPYENLFHAFQAKRSP